MTLPQKRVDYTPLLVKTAAVGLGAAGLLIASSRLLIDRAVPLPEAIGAPRRSFQSRRAGRLSYYADTSAPGRPLLLLHSINAAPSAREMLPLFAYYRRSRPVYALDLPGFGFSERADRRYTPELFAAAIADFLGSEVGEAADVVALSLSSELAARAALEAPELVRSLTMISPSGFGKEGGITQTLAGALPISYGAHGLLTLPLVGQGLYDLISSRRSIEHYLSKSFIGRPPLPLINYAYATSHQPGARHAPLAFLSGLLFTRNARTALYGRLRMPVLVIYDRDPYVDFEELPAFLAGRTNWRAERPAPSRGLPHWEELERTRTALDDFWAQMHPEQSALAPERQMA